MEHTVANVRKHRSALSRLSWLLLGWAALIAGVVGLVLPIIPTTPFVILAAFAFGKSSPHLQAWLESNRHFGPIIDDWRANHAIALRFKVMAIAMMAGVFGASIAISAPGFVLAIQAICIAGAAAFILTRPNPQPANVGSRSR